VTLDVTRESLHQIVRWTQRVLFVVAVSTLYYCGSVLIDAWKFQRIERRQFERTLPALHEAAYPTPPKNPPPAVKGALIGLIKIPRLGLSVIVIEGTSARTLRRAAGHIPGTALPGQPGNVAISGHRDTFFRPLEKIRPDDIITLTTLFGEYRYRVVSTKVVNPYDVTVLKPGRKEILTLVTCFPFYFVGPAPDRFIVRAEREVAGDGHKPAL
jgi:sortase A